MHVSDSTRSLYQKKLAIVMREKSSEEVDSTQNGHQNGHNAEVNPNVAEFSADEETIEDDEDQPLAVMKKSARKTATPKKETKSALQALGTSIRQRFGGEKRENERFTPTPRRSIHSYKVTETTRQTVTKSKDGVTTQDITYTKETSEGEIKAQASKMALFRKILPGILLGLILVALAYYVSSVRI